MALFHFRIKSDKKHLDYIRRQGAFPDFERQPVNTNFVDNLISSAEIKYACGGLDSFLYKTDDFGCIKNTPDGSEVSDNSSPITVFIALWLADNVMNHQPLIIFGSND